LVADEVIWRGVRGANLPTHGVNVPHMDDKRTPFCIAMAQIGVATAYEGDKPRQKYATMA
jgi:hypothetical protein